MKQSFDQFKEGVFELEECCTEVKDASDIKTMYVGHDENLYNLKPETTLEYISYPALLSMVKNHMMPFLDACGVDISQVLVFNSNKERIPFLSKKAASKIH